MSVEGFASWVAALAGLGGALAGSAAGAGVAWGVLRERVAALDREVAEERRARAAFQDRIRADVDAAEARCVERDLSLGRELGRLREDSRDAHAALSDELRRSESRCVERDDLLERAVAETLAEARGAREAIQRHVEAHARAEG